MAMAVAVKTSISIHAPTRGATSKWTSGTRGRNISIHAPTRGATKYTAYRAGFDSDFNPRSHKGSDLLCPNGLTASGHFNPRSHKGSDSIDVDSKRRLRHFNPRSHKGSDHSRISRSCIDIVFQSTLPQGERLLSHRFGMDIRTISIHAPTRGATLLLIFWVLDITFQSTLPQGERPQGRFQTFRFFVISIHAPTRGATKKTGGV